MCEQQGAHMVSNPQTVYETDSSSWRTTRSARGVVVFERGGDVAQPQRIFTMKIEIIKTDVTNFHIRLKYYANKCEYIPVMETPCWNGYKGW